MQSYGFQPDIASFAKGVTSGYIPLGGVAVSDEIFDVMSEPDRMFMHGFTYSGHPVACAVGAAQHPDHRGREPGRQRRRDGRATCSAD